MKVLVVGATGETGKRVVQTLVDRQIAVRALVRDYDSATASLPLETEIMVGDLLQPDSLKAAIANCNVVISAAGARPSMDLTGPFKVDYLGTRNLVDVAKTSGVEQFVLVSSLCVSNLLHPLNLFGLILVWKQWGENYLRQSGVPYTIVRPGGLKNDNNAEAIVMSSADTLFEGSIPRQKVAEVCVESLFLPAAKNKIVEIVTKPEAPAQPFEQLFAQV
ncbi:MAG: SDR family oxidoreductase [Snowella sp.]|nr:SDR family oxidoreductase [Snowella sp.]